MSLNPRIFAAVFLMVVGASWLTVELVLAAKGSGQVDWHMGAAVMLMLAGAVATDPKGLGPAFRDILSGFAQFIPLTKAHRRRSQSQGKEE